MAGRASIDSYLPENEDYEMAPLNPATTTTVHDLYPIDSQRRLVDLTAHYKVYKRRFFGLAVLVLLNIIVSWDWLTFSAVSSTASEFFQVSESDINWLSTGFLFAFAVASPATIKALHRGPKTSILTSAALIFVGNWIRYAGTRSGSHGTFGVVLFGQFVIGCAQPFVLAAPTRYSDLWFPEKGLFGRVSATAIASLANPLGGALGQLIGPMWASQPGDIPNMVLFTATVSCVACLPAILIPSKPPTPASNSGNLEKLNITASLRLLKKNKAFYLVLVAFGIYTGFFNALSSLINQIFEPYGFTETDAGIAGALLIFVGLGASAVISPWVDRTKQYLPTIKLLVPFIALGYLLLIFMPETRTVAGPFVICAILGAASFSLLPCALEYLVEITYPASPEVSSTICWTGGQLLGAAFILMMDALKGVMSGQPKDSMKGALIFQAIISCSAVPCVFALSYLNKDSIGLGRRGVEIDMADPEANG